MTDTVPDTFSLPVFSATVGKVSGGRVPGGRELGETLDQWRISAQRFADRGLDIRSFTRGDRLTSQLRKLQFDRAESDVLFRDARNKITAFIALEQASVPNLYQLVVGLPADIYNLLQAWQSSPRSSLGGSISGGNP